MAVAVEDKHISTKCCTKRFHCMREAVATRRFRPGRCSILAPNVKEKSKINPVHHFQSYNQTPAYTDQEGTVYKSLIYLWALTSSVAFALGGLTLWHAMLITRGETSVERHINRKERKRLRLKGKLFRNPYHHGKINNWKMFFAIEKPSHWLTRVLLPSTHLPHGDGLIWDPPPYKNQTMAI